MCRALDVANLAVATLGALLFLLCLVLAVVHGDRFAVYELPGAVRVLMKRCTSLFSQRNPFKENALARVVRNLRYF